MLWKYYGNTGRFNLIPEIYPWIQDKLLEIPRSRAQCIARYKIIPCQDLNTVENTTEQSSVYRKIQDDSMSRFEYDGEYNGAELRVSQDTM